MADKQKVDSAFRDSLPFINFGKYVTLSTSDCEYLVDKLKQSNIYYVFLNETKIEKDGLKLILSNLNHTKIKNIHLTSESYEDLGISELNNALKHSRLVNLSLCKYEINMNFFISGLISSKLMTLNLSSCKIYNEGWKIFADSLKDTRIVELDLSKCCLNNLSVDYLFGKLPGTKIQKLNLSHNMINSNGLKTFSDNLKDTNITHLNMTFCLIIRSNFISHFFEGLKESKLKNLNMKSNCIGLKGFLSIGNVIEHTKITELNLSSCKMTSDGIETIANNINKSNIRKLNVSFNKLKDEGAILLAEGIKKSKIQYLNIARNFLTGLGISAIINSIDSSKLIDLNLSQNENDDDINAVLIATALLATKKFINLDLSNCLKYDSTIHSFCDAFQFNENNPIESKVNYKFDRDFLNNFNRYVILKLKTGNGWKFFNFKHLVFSFDQISKDDMVYLGKTIKQITKFEAYRVGFSINEFVQLVESMKHSNLRYLKFYECGLGDKHIKNIINNLKHFNINVLSLTNNRISYDTAMLMLNELKHSKLVHLELPKFKTNPDEHKAMMDVLDNKYVAVLDDVNYRFFKPLLREKAKSLIECFDKNIKLQYNESMFEYFYAYESYKEDSDVWDDKNANSPEKIKMIIDLEINENFFYIIDVCGNKKKTYFDKLPCEILEMLSSYLYINEIAL